MGIFNMPIFANGHIFFKWAYFTEYAQKKNLCLGFMGARQMGWGWLQKAICEYDNMGGKSNTQIL